MSSLIIYAVGFGSKVGIPVKKKTGIIESLHRLFFEHSRVSSAVMSETKLTMKASVNMKYAGCRTIEKSKCDLGFRR